MLTPQRTCSYTFEGCYLAATFVKIDQEMHATAIVRTDRQTEFIICPMLYVIAVGHIIKIINATNA